MIGKITKLMFLKIMYLGWAKHVNQLAKIMEFKQEEVKSREWPELRWMNGVDEDLSRLRTKRWW